MENKPSAFQTLINEANKHVKNGMIPIYGLEDTGGYGRSLAVFLLEKGQMVKEVNPALSHSERKNYPTIQKSDSWDAYCIACVLLSKLKTLPDANPQDLHWTIQQLVNRRDAVVKSLTSNLNQLHTQLSHHYPSYRKFFAKVEGPTALVFWEKYPAPYLLADVTAEELAAVLRIPSHNACSARKAQEILALVEKDGNTKRAYQETRDFIVREMVKDIRFKQEQIAGLEQQMRNVVGFLGYKLETMPGIDTVTACALISNIGDINRFPNPNKLARFAGIAPVKFSSGGKGKEQKSRQGNRELHGIFYFLAVQQIQTAKGSGVPRNPVFHEYYQRKVEEGKTKVQAIVCVMRRLVNIIYGMMKNKKAYKMPTLPLKKAI